MFLIQQVPILSQYRRDKSEKFHTMNHLYLFENLSEPISLTIVTSKNKRYSLILDIFFLIMKIKDLLY